MHIHSPHAYYIHYTAKGVWPTDVLEEVERTLKYSYTILHNCRRCVCVYTRTRRARKSSSKLAGCLRLSSTPALSLRDRWWWIRCCCGWLWCGWWAATGGGPEARSGGSHRSWWRCGATSDLRNWGWDAMGKERHSSQGRYIRMPQQRHKLTIHQIISECASVSRLEYRVRQETYNSQITQLTSPSIIPVYRSPLSTHFICYQNKHRPTATKIQQNSNVQQTKQYSTNKTAMFVCKIKAWCTSQRREYVCQRYKGDFRVWSHGTAPTMRTLIVLVLPTSNLVTQEIEFIDV